MPRCRVLLGAVGLAALQPALGPNAENQAKALLGRSRDLQITPCLAKTKTVPAAIWSRDAVTNEDSVFNFPVPADAGGVRVPPDNVRACQSLQSDELGAVVWDAAVFLAWYLCQHLGCQVAATFLESKAQSDTAKTHFLLPGTIGSARMLASWMSLSVCCCFRCKPQDRTPERACKAMYMLRRLPSTNDT